MPTYEGHDIMGVDFYSTLGGPLIDVERRRRENRGAEGGGCEGGAPSPENFSIADLKMVSFDAFCVVFKKFRSICQHLGIRLYY